MSRTLAMRDTDNSEKVHLSPRVSPSAVTRSLLPKNASFCSHPQKRGNHTLERQNMAYFRGSSPQPQASLTQSKGIIYLCRPHFSYFIRISNLFKIYMVCGVMQFNVKTSLLEIISRTFKKPSSLIDRLILLGLAFYEIMRKFIHFQKVHDNQFRCAEDIFSFCKGSF